MKCFADIPGDTVTIGDGLGLEGTGGGTQTIPKNQFVECKNDHLDPEPFVECKECGRKSHQICVLHLDAVWPEGYVNIFISSESTHVNNANLSGF